MTGSLLQFLVCAALIVVAGAALTQFGDIISERTRFGGLLVGSILIAGATSLPELAIDINAVRMGSPDLAVGDLMGSSLFNLLILAALDLTRYSGGRMLSRTLVHHAIAGTTSIALTAVAAIFLFVTPKLGDATFLRLGPGSFALAFAYFVGIRIVFFAQQQHAAKRDDSTRSGPKRTWFGELGLKGAVLGYLVAAAVILIAAPFLAHAADDLAERSGMGGTFFGSTFVALCTSLPEIVTTFAAVRMKAFDLAVGNIFGSNCFNMAIIVPLDLVDAGSLFAAAQQTHVYTALCVIVVTSVMILGQLFRVERRKHFLEPDAWLAIALIAATFTGLYFIRE